MNPEKAQQLAKDTNAQIEKLEEGRLPNVDVLDIYAEDGFIIGPVEILESFNKFETKHFPDKVEELRQALISTLTEMNRIVDETRLKVQKNHEEIDLSVAELKATLFDNIRNVPESLLTRKMRVGKKIIEEADQHFLQEAYNNLGFKYCEISIRSDYIYFDPEAGEIRQPFLKEFHRITGNKYPSLSNYVQCENSRIENLDVLLYVVSLNK